MRYYLVAIADISYKGGDPLTYGHSHSLAVGSIVLVPVRNRLVTGIVVKNTINPSFAVKQIATVFDLPPLPGISLLLMNWLQHYYAAPLGMTTAGFLPGSLTDRTALTPVQPAFDPPDTTNLPKLTLEQQTALQKLPASGTSLLHGDTGTGKTRMYLEKALAAINSGRSVLLLTPEISLTSQLVRVFQATFKNRVLLTHSNLTTAQRRSIWLTVLTATEPLIVIGPRSTLFTPLKNIGLIVIDEAHDDAYKQENTPSYNALRVAAHLGSLHGASVIFGSATPAISDYYMLEQKKRPIVRLTERPLLKAEAKTTVKLVDMRERTNFTQNNHLSNQLLSEIKSATQQGEQTLLFLNRRGSARSTLCSSCGWRALCEHCGTPMTFHEDSFNLRCHTCGRHTTVPTTCPDCGGGELLFKSAGTKAIEAVVTSLFPSARVMRFDTDNKKAERLESHYDSLKDGSVDVIIGTQMIAKGLDLPRLRVVGVINADLSLQIPDFTAEEKTYQLLSQVVGRVGRGHRDGHVIIQTYSPGSKVLEDAIHTNWNDFYSHELAERKAFLFPPFCHLLVLTVRRAKSATAEKAAYTLQQSLQQKESLVIEGPMPNYHERVDGQYEWRLVVKSTSRAQLIDTITNLPAGWHFDIDPVNLL